MGVNPIIWLVLTVLSLYSYVVFIWLIMSWLIGFNILNPRQQLVFMINNFCESLVMPALKPIKRYIPPLGGMDLSPVVLLLGLEFLNRLIIYIF